MRTKKCFSKKYAGLAVLAFWCLAVAAIAQEANENSAQNPCLTAREEAELGARVEANRSRLRQEGRLAAPNSNSKVNVQFRWPLYPTNEFEDFSYWKITNFVDQDPDEGDDEVLDYNCGSRTYDGHTGIDIALRPFKWNMMADEVIDVVAAADGVIVDKEDGNFDLNCDWEDPPPANYVVLEHEDGTRSYYYHLKKWSVTSKDIGDSVEGGEYLGKVGSSGRSTGPHLHFAVKDADDNTQEPFAGPCNEMNDDSYWLVQLPYHVPTILRLATFAEEPEEPDCVVSDDEPKDNFALGEPITFGVYARDINTGDEVNTFVFRPNGTLKWNLETNWNNGYRDYKSLYYDKSISNDGAGEWTILTSYANQIFEQKFNTYCKATYLLVGVHEGVLWRIASDHITSAAVIPSALVNIVNYQADHYIRLIPGFRAEAGCLFKAALHPCEQAGEADGEAENLRLRPQNDDATAPISQRESGDLPAQRQGSAWAKLYPTAASEGVSLSVSLPREESVFVTVFDAQGHRVQQLVFEYGFPESEQTFGLSCANWPPGIYRVLVRAGEEWVICPMVKN
ncbi:MAG: peptidoglycan DD-metalloendopeptidase family protein [Saprospiraceae bacterium]